MSSHPGPFTTGGSRRRLIAAVVAAGMITASAAAINPAAATAGPPPTTTAGGTITDTRTVATPGSIPEAHTVTLVTGDVVTVRTLADGKTLTEVDQPDDATGGFTVQQHGDDLYVLPDEAKPLLADDRLDQRLFNVTDLIEMGYGDADTSDIPLIATYPETSARTTTAPAATTLTHDLPAINGHALTTDKEDTRTLWTTLTTEVNHESTGVTKLWLDGQVAGTLAESVPQIGAPEAWDAGYDGDGVTVAVLDSGIDPTHPDLTDQIQDTVSFVPDEDTTDPHGHGTHVASTVAGTGTASNGDNTGVAPEADLIIGKVLSNEGYGLDSWIIAGMQWAAESGADIINMSLGDSSRTDGLDPLTLAVDTLSTQHDTLFVVAAGNNGTTIGTPGTAASALTVGAVDKQDQLARFSSVGPLARTGALKPDLTAPGVAINAARSQQSPGDGMYQSLDGTSMATPHVAGAAAILAQQHPDWTNTQLKNALMSSTEALRDSYTAYQVGTGRLDVAAAVNTTVRATGSAYFGYFDWPHQPTDTPVTKPVTLTNTSTTPVTLNLTTTGNNAFTLNDTTTITIPAEGQIDVPVTGDPRGDTTGEHTGYLIGTNPTTGKTVTRTALALLKEDERHDLTIKLRDRNGEPTSARVAVKESGDSLPEFFGIDGEKTLRLPPGIYTVYGELNVPGERADSLGFALLVAPETVLDKPTEVTLDASQARLLDTTTPQRTENRQRKLEYVVDYPEGSLFGYTYNIPDTYDDLYVLPTGKSTESSFAMAAKWRKGAPVLSLRAFGLLPIDAMIQRGSTITTGKQWLRPVYAGTGTPDDYTDLDADGTIAVVTRSDDISPSDRAAAAAAAGAALLLVVNDKPGILDEYVGSSPIPVASVHRDIGNILIKLAKHGTPPLKVSQEQYPDTIYDLVQLWREQVPDQPLTYHPRHSDLARIDARYHAVQDTIGTGNRADLTLGLQVGIDEPESHPGTRTEWVTPNIPWAESHKQHDWRVEADAHTYTKGTTTRLDWFAPAIRPAFNQRSSIQNRRYQNRMTLYPQPWSPSGTELDYIGRHSFGSVPTSIALYQGETLLHENPRSADLQDKEVPAGTLPYRLVLDASRSAEEWGLSTRTHTEWDFISSTNDADRNAPEPLTLLQLDYELDTDLRGDVEAGTRQEISITARPQPGGSGTGTITAVELEVSYDDGTTWKPVKLTQGDGDRHTGTLKLPKQPDGFISVRAAAETDTGFAIHQELIRAYGLR